MAEAKLYNTQGEAVGEVHLNDAVFAVPVRPDLISEVARAMMASKRQGTASTKTRKDVRGSGAKPWRQKGTGRARHGSIRAPQWVGGGKVFTPKPRYYGKKMPKKMRRAALRSAITMKHSSDELIIVDEIILKEPKTKLMAEVLEKITGSQDCLIVYPARDENYDLLARSIRNIPDATIILADYLNIRDLLSHEKVILVKSGLDRIAEILLRE